MGNQGKKFFFILHLVASSTLFSVAEKVQITNETADETAENFLKEFERDLDVYYKKAPVNPDNAIDEEDTPRFLFLLALLPKVIIGVAKLAMVIGSFAVKAAVVAKANAMAIAAVAAAHLPAVAITVAKHILVDVAVSVVIDVVEDQITAALAPEESETEYGQLDLVDMYETESEKCKCLRKKYCSCCVKPVRFEEGCLNITLTDTLWNNDSFMHVGAFYDGKEIITRKLKVSRYRQRCQILSPPFNTTNLCVSNWGREFIGGNRVVQCVSVFFNRRGASRCLVQNKDNRLWIKQN